MIRRNEARSAILSAEVYPARTQPRSSIRTNSLYFGEPASLKFFYDLAIDAQWYLFAPFFPLSKYPIELITSLKTAPEKAPSAERDDIKT